MAQHFALGPFAVMRLRERLEGRARQNEQTAKIHPDEGIRRQAAERAAAYRVAIDDLDIVVEDDRPRGIVP